MIVLLSRVVIGQSLSFALTRLLFYYISRVIHRMLSTVGVPSLARSVWGYVDKTIR